MIDVWYSLITYSVLRFGPARAYSGKCEQDLVILTTLLTIFVSIYCFISDDLKLVIWNDQVNLCLAISYIQTFQAELDINDLHQDMFESLCKNYIGSCKPQAMFQM